jgi:Tol biopolymer transport system component
MSTFIFFPPFHGGRAGRTNSVVEGRRDFLTREPISGDLLSERLRRPLPPGEALKLAIGVARAIGRAHAKGRVHGGLCPFCIVITKDGTVTLTDPPSSPIDRAAYQAPEEFSGERPDARSDIFAFGAVVYEIASGKRAFPGTGAELKEVILTRAPLPFKHKSPVHTTMMGVITSCLEKNPELRRQRIQNAAIELRMCATVARTQEMLMYRRGLGPGTDPRLLGAVPLPPGAARAASPRSQTITAAAPEVLASSDAAVAVAPPEISDPPPAPPRMMAAGAKFPGWSEGWMWPPPKLTATDRLMHFANGLSRRAWLMIGALALTATSVAAVVILRGRAAQPVLQFSVAQPENTSFPGMPAVSPDGRYLTFSAVGQEGKRMLWLRPLDALHATMIPGTEGATAPFWAPDSQYIAFFAGRALKRVKISGGTSPETICPAESAPGGGAWNKDGTILFSPSLSDAFYRVPATGGKPIPVLKLDEGKFERGDLWPQFLPDGKHFVFYLQTDLTETSGVYAASLDGTEYKKLFASQTNAVYSSGYLLFINERNLMAQQFDPGKLEIIDTPSMLGSDIGALRSLSLAPISVSNTGVLVYQGVGKPVHQVVWLDRAGRQLAAVGEPSEYGPPRISPNGDRAVLAKIDPGGKSAHLWLADMNGGMTQLDNGPLHEGAPVWSPDGTRIAYFVRQSDQNYDLYQRVAQAGSKPELLYKSSAKTYPTDWSHDGKYLMFYKDEPGTRLDIWGFSMAEKRAAPIVNTVYTEAFATISPNGKWMAFQSDHSGRNEIYVQFFDGLIGGTRKMWQISSGGGLPRWRGDSAELFYMTSDGRVMAVSFRENNGEVQTGTPVKLFQTRPLPKTWNLYDVSSDGQRFVVTLPLEWTSSVPITVVTNWAEKLKE